MPEAIPPFMNPDGDSYDPTRETEEVAKAVFARHYHCLVKEVDDLLDGSPDLQTEFDAIMDYVARDALTDDCNMAVADVAFIHLSDLGLVNAVPVKIVPGVAIATHSPRQLERALVNRK